MVIKRKGYEPKVKEIKPEGPKPKKVSKSFDLTKLVDLVIEGKVSSPSGTIVFFERTRDGRKAIHTGKVFTVSDTGNVEIWDETVNQFYTFNLLGPIPIVKIKA